MRAADLIPPDSGRYAASMLPLSTIKDRLSGIRYRANAIAGGAGVYACFLAAPGALAGLSVEPSGLIYLGRTSNLEVRNNFAHRDSGFSTLRRSLGALLKEELRLQAIPRGDVPLRNNWRYYRFREEDEQRLTDWMIAHLTYGFAIVGDDIKTVEQALIAELRPPLNLTGWPTNPQEPYLRKLRDACRDEARRTARSIAAQS
jgi:hypothetical protein